MVVIGNSSNEEPVPSTVPPHKPEYQLQAPPVPRLPPVIPNVVDVPSQIVVSVAVIEDAWAELVLTVIVMLAQIVVLHIPSALTK